MLCLCEKVISDHRARQWESVSPAQYLRDAVGARQRRAPQRDDTKLTGDRTDGDRTEETEYKIEKKNIFFRGSDFSNPSFPYDFRLF